MIEPHWNANWAWSLPLIVLTVVIHVVGLGLVNEAVVNWLGGLAGRRRFMPAFALVMGTVAMLVTMLHALEAIFWAAAYRALGALPDTGSAVLYSVGAMTTYGHETFGLAPHWRLMGALEALNGMLLFGLTTAFMYSMIQRVWPLGSRGRDRPRHRAAPTRPPAANP